MGTRKGGGGGACSVRDQSLFTSCSRGGLWKEFYSKLLRQIDKGCSHQLTATSKLISHQGFEPCSGLLQFGKGL